MFFRQKARLSTFESKNKSYSIYFEGGISSKPTPSRPKNKIYNKFTRFTLKKGGEIWMDIEDYQIIQIWSKSVKMFNH